MLLEKIRLAIEKSGMSRYQIAKDTGISESVLCKIMQGGSAGHRTLDKLCEYLGLELREKKKGR